MVVDVDHVGVRVRRCRLWRGLTQQELADLAGWSKSAVSMLETGARGLDSRVRLRQVAEALRVSPADLTGEPYPLDTPGLADAQAHVPDVERALMAYRIGDSAQVQPRSLEVLAAEVRGPLVSAEVRADDGVRLAMLPSLVVELQSYGGDEGALRLLSLVCAEATQALQNVGQVPLAWIAAERCAQAAALVGDPVLVGVAEFARAHALPTGGQGMGRAGPAADRLAGELMGGGRWGREVYGMLRLTAALAAQVRGDAAESAAQAAEAARVAQVLGERSDAWEYFGPANVGVWRATLAVEAGEPARALEHATTTDALALSPGRRAQLLLETARAHHQLGRAHHRQAVAALRQAEQLAPVRMRASPWARELVEVMLGRSRRDAGGRELRALAYRMGLDAS
jgi:transcriptional regulator with XRE-family HTH domain